MATTSYGNSFGRKTYNAPTIERINVWDRTDEFYPVGAVLPVSTTYPEGTIIPAGTPVAIDKVGGTPTLNSATPTGHTYEDVVMGSEFATLTIVTRGTLLISRVKATITEAQQTALKGQIIYVKEA